MKPEAEQTTVEIDGAIHVADRHADVFEGFQHCRRGLLSPAGG
jgi:hypothetical protein